MDFTNAKDKRMRVDYEYDQPPTIEQWQELIANLTKEEYITPTGNYAIAKVNGVLIYTELRAKFEITIYMNVDLAGLIK